MKPGSYWLFKETLLMFSYILVVSRGYILLISSCPMLRTGKLHIISSSAILLFKNYFKGGQKYDGFLLSCTKMPLIILCLKSQQSTLWVDFKIESYCKPAERKWNFI